MLEKIKNFYKVKKPLKLCLTVLLILIIVVLIALFSNKSVKPLYDKDGNPVYLEENEYKKIFQSTDQYLGKFVKFKGQILSEPESYDDDTYAFQVYTDVEKREGVILVYTDIDLDVKSDDYVVLEGYVGGTVTGTNAMGGTISNPLIVTSNIRKSDYIEAVSPTIKEVSYNDKKINQYGCQLEINKIEFSDIETRIYVTATNNSNDVFSIYTYSIKMVQNGKQYDNETNYDADYKELQDELSKGVTSTGILVFPKVDQSDLKLIIEGSSDNWDIDLSDYVFNLEI